MQKVKRRSVGRPRRIAVGEQRRLELRCSEHEHALIQQLSEISGTSMNVAVLAAVERYHASLHRRMSKGI